MSTSTVATPSTAAGTPSAAPTPTSVPHVISRRLSDLVHSIHPGTKLEPELEAWLLELCDDFVDDVVVRSSLIARHRHSNSLDVKDVQLHLEQHWGMRVPGYFQPEDALPNAVRRPLEDGAPAADDGRGGGSAAGAGGGGGGGAGGGAAGGGGGRRGKNVVADIPGLKLRVVRRPPMSEGHRRRLNLVTAAKAGTGEDGGDGAGEDNKGESAGGEGRKRKRTTE